MCPPLSPSVLAVFVFQGVSPLSPLCFGVFWRPAPSYVFLCPAPSYVFWCLPCQVTLWICNWKMENGKQNVYMNHFTLGEKRQPVKKNQHPPSSRIFPLIHSYYVILFSIFQLRSYKVQSTKYNLGFVVCVLVETSPKEKCPEFFFLRHIPPENSH